MFPIGKENASVARKIKTFLSKFVFDTRVCLDFLAFMSWLILVNVKT